MKITTSNKLKRAKARNNLKGHWSMMILMYTSIPIIPAILLDLFSITLNNNSSVVIVIACLIVFISSLLLSILLGTAFIVHLIDLEEMPSTSIKPYDRIKRIQKKNVILKMYVVTLLVLLKTFLWSLLFIVPGIIKALAYSQSVFIAYDAAIKGDSKSAFTSIKESTIMMNGAKSDLLVFKLIFLGWGLLATILIVLLSTTKLSPFFTQFAMLSFIVLIVYLEMAQVVYYQELKYNTLAYESDDID